jgi:hypothetical protein
VAIQKLKEGDFYRNCFGDVFQILNLDWNKKIATIKLINISLDYEFKWDFEDFPIDLERAKLTPLEVELL